MSNDQSKFDLRERTLNYSKEVISLCKKLPQDVITKPLIVQLVRSGTSIGANYCEADEGSSKKDFINKLCIANKEAKEISYWLKVIEHALSQFKPEITALIVEARELNLIFSSIIRKSRD